jgi:hypothetical protein
VKGLFCDVRFQDDSAFFFGSENDLVWRHRLKERMLSSSAWDWSQFDNGNLISKSEDLMQSEVFLEKNVKIPLKIFTL